MTKMSSTVLVLMQLLFVCVYSKPQVQQVIDHEQAMRDKQQLQGDGSSHPQSRSFAGCIVGGDFNSLTRADYSDERWAEIAAIRRKSLWEAPRHDLTELREGEGGFGFRRPVSSKVRGCFRVILVGGGRER